jgi:ribosomal-protein-alanine N-acetyltransferase
MAPLAIPSIETERLILRGPTSVDVPDWATFIFADPAVMRYMPRRDLAPIERAERAYANFARLWEQWAKGTVQGFGWVIRRKSDERFIGTCELDYFEQIEAGEVGFLVATAFWGQGFEVEAARAIVRFGFDHTAWAVMVEDVIPGNTEESDVFKQLGFVYTQHVNYYELMGDTSFELDHPLVEQYALSRERFAPGDAVYRLHTS